MIAVEESGDFTYPSWAGYKAVESGIKINPVNLIFESIDDENERVAFDSALYLRLIYGVTKHDPTTTILFSFDGSPLIQVTR